MFLTPILAPRSKNSLRREEWDANVRAFVKGYGRPLILSGDLNVAHEDADLTHPAFFKVRLNKAWRKQCACLCFELRRSVRAGRS